MKSLLAILGFTFAAVSFYSIGALADETPRPPELEPAVRVQGGVVFDSQAPNPGATFSAGTDDLRTTQKLDQDHSAISVNLGFGYIPNSGFIANFGLQRDIPTAAHNLFFHLGEHNIVSITPGSSEAVLPAGMRLKLGQRAYLDMNAEPFGIVRNNTVNTNGSGLHSWESGLSINGGLAVNDWITLLAAAKIAATFGGTDGYSQKQIGVGVRPTASAEAQVEFIPGTLALTVGMSIADNIAKVVTFDGSGNASASTVDHNVEKLATAGIKYIF